VRRRRKNPEEKEDRGELEKADVSAAGVGGGQQPDEWEH